MSTVETGSLVRAPEQLNVTQSTVTARLHTPEQELRATLLLHQKFGRLFEMPGAPTFPRNIFLIINPNAATRWPWMPELVARFGG